MILYPINKIYLCTYHIYSISMYHTYIYFIFYIYIHILYILYIHTYTVYIYCIHTPYPHTHVPVHIWGVSGSTPLWRTWRAQPRGSACLDRSAGTGRRPAAPRPEIGKEWVWGWVVVLVLYIDRCNKYRYICIVNIL